MLQLSGVHYKPSPRQTDPDLPSIDFDSDEDFDEPTMTEGKEERVFKQRCVFRALGDGVTVFNSTKTEES